MRSIAANKIDRHRSHYRHRVARKHEILFISVQNSDSPTTSPSLCRSTTLFALSFAHSSRHCRRSNEFEKKTKPKYVFNLTANWWYFDHYARTYWALCDTFRVHLRCVCAESIRIVLILCGVFILRKENTTKSVHASVWVHCICYRNTLNAPRSSERIRCALKTENDRFIDLLYLKKH